MTKVGYQLSSITPYLDTVENLKTSFRKIAEMGYKYVQLQGAALDIPDEEIKAALDENGLVCVATQEDYILGFGDDPDRYIRRAVAVGAEYLIFALLPFDISTVKELERYAENILKIKEKANAVGLKFGFHPIGFDFRLIEGVPAYERFMAMLPEDTQLTLCVQSTFGSTVKYTEVLEKFKGRIDLMHFKDGIAIPDDEMAHSECYDDWLEIYETNIPAGVNNIAYIINNHAISNEHELNSLIRKLLNCKRKIQLSELAFAYHPTCMDYDLIDGDRVLDLIMSELGSDAHIVLSDTAVIDDYYQELCRNYPGRVHVIRNDGEKLPTGFKVQLTPLGEGAHCWNKIWKDSVDAGVKYVFTEQERWTRDAFDCAKTSLDYMKRITR